MTEAMVGIEVGVIDKRIAIETMRGIGIGQDSQLINQLIGIDHQEGIGRIWILMSQGIKRMINLLIISLMILVEGLPKVRFVTS